MELIPYLLSLLAIGLVVGAFARLALPGRDPMSIPATIGVGVAGSLIAGLLARLVLGPRTNAGLLLSIACAAVIVYLVRRSRGGSLTSPGRARSRR